VNRGATLGGILAYRGEVRDNIAQHRHTADWSFGSLLTYFSSNNNSHMSFSPFFRETRARLFLVLQSKISGTANKVQETYLLVCAEETKHPDIMSKVEHPTFYREDFVRALQENPEDFDLFGTTRCRGILTAMRRTVDSVKDLDPSHPNFAQHNKIATGLAHFFSFDPSKRASLGTKPSASKDIPHSHIIDLDVTKYQDCSEYRIFTGLIRKMPGFRTRETVEIVNVEDLTDAVEVLGMDDMTDKSEGLEVANDMGLTSMPAGKDKHIDILALDPVDLSHLGDVVIFDF
jgi:hypothetical protein